MKEPMSVTRRKFTQGVLTAAAGTLSARGMPHALAAMGAPSLTGNDVIAAIKAHLNMPWDAKTVRDTLKGGDPGTPVQGVACCFMDTLEVLKKAKAQGLNMVVTHEPTYWTDQDLIEPIKDDPLYLEKRKFIESNRMIVFRLHDHWHRFRPEPMTTGTQRLLQWELDPSGARLYRLSPTRLKDVAQHVATRLYSRSVRVVGDPELIVSTVMQGGHALAGNITALAQADVALSSEVREWETVEYVRDLIATGAKKGLIVISHEAGEEEGMKIFAEWMATVTPTLRTAFISTNDRLYLV